MATAKVKRQLKAKGCQFNRSLTRLETINTRNEDEESLGEAVAVVLDHSKSIDSLQEELFGLFSPVQARSKIAKLSADFSDPVNFEASTHRSNARQVGGSGGHRAKPVFNPSPPGPLAHP